MEGVYFVFSSEKWLTRPLSVIYSVSFFHSSPKFVDRVKATLAKRVFFFLYSGSYIAFREAIVC